MRGGSGVRTSKFFLVYLTSCKTQCAMYSTIKLENGATHYTLRKKIFTNYEIQVQRALESSVPGHTCSTTFRQTRESRRQVNSGNWILFCEICCLFCSIPEVVASSKSLGVWGWLAAMEEEEEEEGRCVLAWRGRAGWPCLGLGLARRSGGSRRGGGWKVVSVTNIHIVRVVYPRY